MPLFLSCFPYAYTFIETLRSFKYTSSLTLECRDSLPLIFTHRKVTPTFIPGHIGTEGNETVNIISKKILQFLPLEVKGVSYSTGNQYCLNQQKEHNFFLSLSRES